MIRGRSNSGKRGGLPTFKNYGGVSIQNPKKKEEIRDSIPSVEMASTKPSAQSQEIGIMNLDVTARTNISGVVNGHPTKGTVLASFNTGRGGRSACEFTHLPPGLTPATFGNLL
jgi:hypothetical protein